MHCEIERRLKYMNEITARYNMMVNRKEPTWNGSLLGVNYGSATLKTAEPFRHHSTSYRHPKVCGTLSSGSVAVV